MNVNGVSNSSMPIMSVKVALFAKNLSQGRMLQPMNKQGKYDTLELGSAGIELSSIAKASTSNKVPQEITHTEIEKADFSLGEWVITIYADGTVDDPLAEYARSQGDYRHDLFVELLDLKSLKGVYSDCIQSGMSREEAGKIQDEAFREHFRKHAREASNLVFELIPPDENVTGELLQYSDVYDENGTLKAPR